MASASSVQAALEMDEARERAKKTAETGTIGRIAASLDDKANNLLGFLLSMSYDEATIVTCDAWKRNCGGVPKNSFVVEKLGSSALAPETDESIPPVLILARVTDAAGTPVSSEIQQTLFQIHKVQAEVDPYTNIELQWSALRVTILGTYYDDQHGKIAFGNDIDTFVSPHFYQVFVPAPGDLEMLINSFVAGADAIQIGELRYTETRTRPSRISVPIRVSPIDFVANRTALFGQTRSGKSNTIKVIADMMLRSKLDVGQLIFDLNGEYSNINSQDRTSLYAIHRDSSVRYGLNVNSRQTNDPDEPKQLKVNFYEQIELGHHIIQSLFDSENISRPQYIRPFLEWAPVDPDQLSKISEYNIRNRAIRGHSMYRAALASAEYLHDNQRIDLMLNQPIRRRLAQDPDLSRIAGLKEGSSPAEIERHQSLNVAVRVYEKLYELHEDRPNDSDLFPTGSTGEPYLDKVHLSLLQMLGDRSISGTRYLVPFAKYHSLFGGNVADDIVVLLNNRKTVIIDLANADEAVANFFSELICRSVFREQMRKFTNNELRDHSVLIYFEEAHNLFRRDDKDLRSIYNRLAKEGAKNRIGMVYATQSMTTLSPDLLKNTENFFIAHLNDDREIRELTYKYEFKDFGLDIQRSKTQGYVRMITLSHRYALPVQIRKFGPELEG